MQKQSHCEKLESGKTWERGYIKLPVAFLGMPGTEYVGMYPSRMCAQIQMLDISYDRWHLEMLGTFSVRGIPLYFYRMCTVTSVPSQNMYSTFLGTPAIGYVQHCRCDIPDITYHVVISQPICI